MKYLLLFSVIALGSTANAYKLNCEYEHKNLKTAAYTRESKTFEINSLDNEYKLRQVEGSEITVVRTMVDGKLAILIHDGDARIATASSDKVISLQAYPINNSEYDVECVKE